MLQEEIEGMIDNAADEIDELGIYQYPGMQTNQPKGRERIALLLLKLNALEELKDDMESTK